MADVESKSIPHELPSSHWLKATGQCVLERYLSATMPIMEPRAIGPSNCWAQDYQVRLKLTTGYGECPLFLVNISPRVH